MAVPVWLSLRRALRISTYSAVSSSSPIHTLNRSPRINSDAAPGAVWFRKSIKARVRSGLAGSRCRSAISRTVSGGDSGFIDRNSFDYDVFKRHILMTRFWPGTQTLYFIDHVHAIDNLAKHCITPTLAGFAGMVQKL